MLIARFSKSTVKLKVLSAPKPVITRLSSVAILLFVLGSSFGAHLAFAQVRLKLGAASQNIPTRVEPRSGLQFIQVPEGKYHLLEPISDTTSKRTSAEHRARKFQHMKPLWFAVTDVTVAAFEKCVDAGKCSGEVRSRDEGPARCNWRNQRFNHPLNCVTWPEAMQFCKWIGGRLPSTTEWEYAATSGNPNVTYPWGSNPVDGTRANYCDANCPKALGTDGKNLLAWEKRGWIDLSQDDGWASTSPVGTYQQGKTPWGLLDMAGNVWQWTSTQAGKDKREVRGGSWDNAPASLTTIRRLPWPESSADSGMGFRCVIDRFKT